MRIIYLIPAVLLLVFCGPVLAVTIVGHSVDDAIDQVNGVCSLREAMLDARAQSDPANFTTVINVPPDVIGDFAELEKNTQLNVFDGGQIGVVFGSSYNYDATANVEVNVYGGSIGEGFGVMGHGRVNIFGGFIDLSAFFDSGVTVRMTGGSIDTNLTLSGTEAPTAMFLEGGTVGAFLDIDQGATLHLSGGSIGEKLEVFDGGRLNVIGSEFFIDGQPLAGLVLDEAFAITQRGGAVLSGTLLDGASFSIDLNASNPSGDLLADVFYGTALLTVTRSDQPSDPGDPGDDRIFGDAFLLPDPRVGQMP